MWETRKKNEEIQFGSTVNQRNPLHLSWTEKPSYQRDAAIHRSRIGKCFTHLWSRSYAVQIARNALLGWESHGSRIIKASFKTNKERILMNVIQFLCTHK
ncbi:unnamed protein product [Schistosoma margrebowiei]|uniref:Uncharacterized protein n=1 Tax=Schistosoma margrebowiei TaxID=48269 RepID=A0A183MUS1_9TREM|nr:unnamed protein product [Schistosoma margrebowiei]